MTVSAQTQRTMLTWRNGNWGHLPHRDYFHNVLEEHLKKIGNNQMSRKREETAVLAQIDAGLSVTVNGIAFRYKHEGRHDHQGDQRQAA